MNVFLVGFMGSGKTTLGKRVADRMGLDFIDLDNYIEQQEGKTIAEIFEKEGEEAFRMLEHQSLLLFANLDGKVVSTGGGAPCFNNNMTLMNDMGLTIYLKIKPGILASRLIYSQTERPLIKGKSIKELTSFINEKLSEREKYYSKARITIEGENIKPSDIVTQVQSALDMGGLS